MARKEKVSQSLSGGVKWHNKSESYRTDALKAAKVESTKTQIGQSNAAFAKTNQAFIAACEKVDIPATSRQASKFRCKRGKAYQGG